MINTFLQGIKVLDFTKALAGPHCTLLLADMGADVIKVENPRDEKSFGRIKPPLIDEMSSFFVYSNRNKRGVAVDMKKPEGAAMFRKLVEGADILVENNRPGVMERLGFGYEDCAKLNPGLIYASISGFGQTGKYNKAPGFDNVAQAMGGGMSVTGFPEDAPVAPGNPFCDVLGGMNACNAILAALYGRKAAGRGQYIDCSLVDSLVSCMGPLNSISIYGDTMPVRRGNHGGCDGDVIDGYKAKGDINAAFVIECDTQEMFEKLCSAIGHEELATDPRFADREARIASYRAGDPLRTYIEEWAADKLPEEAADLLLRAGVAAAPVHYYTDIFHDPHTMARGMMRPFETEKGEKWMLGNPILVNDKPADIRRGSFKIGRDDDEVLAEFGATEAEIAAARACGAIV